MPKYACAVRLKCKTVCIPQSFHSRRGVKMDFSHNQHSRINLSAALAQTCLILTHIIINMCLRSGSGAAGNPVRSRCGWWQGLPILTVGTSMAVTITHVFLWGSSATNHIENALMGSPWLVVLDTTHSKADKSARGGTEILCQRIYIADAFLCIYHDDRTAQQYPR
jgi:hypothetical protein